MEFSLNHVDAGCAARLGRVVTSHGTFETPIFMPVGTVGSVKGVAPRVLADEIGAEIILGNTYHLYLRPGTEILEKAGGLHTFSGWDGPILTDSGGFQVFSLSGIRKISEEGVRFQSHLDGSYHDFTPESVVDTQRSIGADIMMVLDECPAGDVSEAYARNSNELTVRWARRCQDRFASTDPLYGFDQALFAIVQGVVYPDVRRDSARQLVDLDFPGYAIGGLSVGESHDQMYEMVAVVNEQLPTDKPRYLMGVGTPQNLLRNISLGVDMFDCVMPTRNGRNGMLFTTEGEINIRNAKWKDDFSPIDPGLPNYYSTTFSKAYLRHLLMSNEILGLEIASVQNLSFYLWLMHEARAAIAEDRFEQWRTAIEPRVSRRL
ncbi:MAG: tRNA guanosine(34) transglycosylase Tgt [Bacteroidetes bacterium]|nr:tRNA guanosine(34) transglycosylase Tgt [Bacteroidota bacterium]